MLGPCRSRVQARPLSHSLLHSRVQQLHLSRNNQPHNSAQARRSSLGLHHLRSRIRLSSHKKWHNRRYTSLGRQKAARRRRITKNPPRRWKDLRSRRRLASRRTKRQRCSEEGKHASWILISTHAYTPFHVCSTCFTVYSTWSLLSMHSDPRDLNTVLVPT